MCEFRMLTFEFRYYCISLDLFIFQYLKGFFKVQELNWMHTILFYEAFYEPTRRDFMTGVKITDTCCFARPSG